MVAEAVASPAAGEVYQVKLPGDSESTWRDATESAYAVTTEAHRRIVYRAPQPAQADTRPTDDELWDQTLRERDEYHETADKLAAAIGKHFGVDIGEHSNANCPWEEALEVIENAVQAGAPVGLTDEQIMSVWRAAPWPDRAGVIAFARALLSAHPGQPEPRAEVTECCDHTWASCHKGEGCEFRMWLAARTGASS